jgi:hypothetical protein
MDGLGAAVVVVTVSGGDGDGPDPVISARLANPHGRVTDRTASNGA